MKKINFNIILGIFLLFIGVVMALKVFNIAIYIDYGVILWSFITLVGVILMINENKINIFSSIITFVGLWNLLNEFNVINTSIFSLIFPIIIVIIGLNLIFSNKIITKINVKNKGNLVTFNGIFGGVNESITDNNFKGLEANAIFGSVELDLSKMDITENIQLNLNAVFGGVNIILSDKFNVNIVNSIGIFGGTDNKYTGINDESKKTIYITSNAIFGGIEIKGA